MKYYLYIILMSDGMFRQSAKYNTNMIETAMRFKSENDAIEYMTKYKIKEEYKVIEMVGELNLLG